MEHPLENMKVYKELQDNLYCLNSLPDHQEPYQTVSRSQEVKRCLEVKSKLKQYLGSNFSKCLAQYSFSRLNSRSIHLNSSKIHVYPKCNTYFNNIAEHIGLDGYVHIIDTVSSCITVYKNH